VTAERACPLCKPRRPLREVDSQITPALLRCDGCSGLWAHADAARDARRRYGKRHPVMRETAAAIACRRCRKRIRASAARCGSCGAHQTLACLDCDKPMSRVRVQTVIVDLCRPCRSTWLDPGELALLARWAEVAPVPVAARSESTGGAVLDVAFDPAAELVVRGAGEALSHVPALAEAAGEGAAGAVEVAGEVAAGAVEAVVSLVAGLFDGL